MPAFPKIAVIPRNIALTVLVVIFTTWAFSQYMYRSVHNEPYGWEIFLTYAVGFLRYMIAPWLVTLGLALWGYVIGRFTFRFVVRGMNFRNDLEESIYSIGTGMGLIAILTFCLGLAKLLYPILFGILALLTIGLGYKYVLHFFRSLKKGLTIGNWDILDGSLLILLGLFILNTFLIPNNPSTGFDPINSHFCAPKYYLRDHAVTFFPWINFNNFPQVQEMLLTVEMMIFRDPGSSLMYFYMVLIAVVTYMIGARYFGRTTGLLGAVLFLLIENIYDTGLRGFVEHLLGFYVLLFVHAFLSWYETRDGRWTVLMGIAGGFACGVKYTATVSVLVGLILMFAAWYLHLPKWERKLVGREIRTPDEAAAVQGKKKRWKKSALKKSSVKNKATANKPKSVSIPEDKSTPGTQIQSESEIIKFGLGKAIGIGVLWTVIIASPWYLRNIVLFGNPFFPFFEGLFGGLGLGTLDYMRDQLAVDHEVMLQYFRFQPSAGNLLKLPWHFTFHDNAPWLWRGSPGLTGPFLLALTPAVLFVRRWRHVGILLIAYLVIYYSYWFLFEKMEDQRYMMSAYPIHCLIAAWALYDIFRIEKFSNRNRVHIACLLIIFPLIFSFFYRSTMGMESGTNLAFVEERRNNYLVNRVEGWDIVNYINNRVHDGENGVDSYLPYFDRNTRIYGLALENRRYYLDCPLIGGLFGYANHFDLNEHTGTGTELYEWLREYDCDYIMFNAARSLRMSYAFTVQLPYDETFDEHFEQLRRSGDIILYRLRPGDDP